MNRNIHVLSTLLKKLPDAKLEAYKRFLSPSLLVEFQSEKRYKTPLEDPPLADWIVLIDPSWYIETLKQIPKEAAAFYLSALPDRIKDAITKELSLETPLYLFFPSLQEYVLQEFVSKVFLHNLPLPLSYLPDHPLLFLLQDPSKLKKLVFYLGLYDVALELRTVLKGSILQALEKHLLPDELVFCRKLLSIHPPFYLGQMGLNQWNEEGAILRKITFERGLYRLSIGLSDASSDFIWYVLHMFDQKNAALLQTFPKTTIDKHVVSIILQQILTAWKEVCTVSI